MKRRDPEEPELWSGDASPEIDPKLADAPDDPLGRVLIQHPPELFPAPDADRAAAAAPPGESVSLFGDETAPAEAASAEPLPAAAPAAPRLTAFAADAAVCAIVAAASFLGAAALVRRSPAWPGWLWCALFALVVSFFLVVPTLALFGRTPGMALADLTAEDAEGDKPPFATSVVRWAATAATAALAGIPLATVLFDRRRRTPADLLSRRPLLPQREPVA